VNALPDHERLLICDGDIRAQIVAVSARFMAAVVADDRAVAARHSQQMTELLQELQAVEEHVSLSLLALETSHEH
jgi:hypothetical protein